jgi:hypothetical protein
MLLATAASSAPAGESILVPVADGAIFDQGPFDGIGDSDGISDDSDGTLQVDDFNEGTFVTDYD